VVSSSSSCNKSSCNKSCLPRLDIARLKRETERAGAQDEGRARGAGEKSASRNKIHEQDSKIQGLTSRFPNQAPRDEGTLRSVSGAVRVAGCQWVRQPT
jgi:hypothetical protein